MHLQIRADNIAQGNLAGHRVGHKPCAHHVSASVRASVSRECVGGRRQVRAHHFAQGHPARHQGRDLDSRSM
jgi:hypothetical protein